MDEHYLSHFEKIDVEADISLQEPFAAPREAVKPYSITESEPLEHNTYLTCSMTAVGRFKTGRIHWPFRFWTTRFVPPRVRP